MRQHRRHTHSDKVLERVVAQLAVDVRINRHHGIGREQQGGAVWVCGLDGVHRNAAGSTRFVFDYGRFGVVRAAHLVAHAAAGDVSTSARGEAVDDLD